MKIVPDCIISLRHELHQNPELSMREYHTRERICDFLTYHTSLEVVECDGWIYAVKQGIARKKVELIASEAEASGIEPTATCWYAKKVLGL